MVAPFRAWPYAALAVVQWQHTAPSLFCWVVFRHPMDQNVKPPLATWIVEVDGVPKTPGLSAWVDEWTLLLTVAAIAALPVSVTVEYDGPDENLRTTWQKQWEPWGAIVATSFQVIPVGVITLWSGAIVDIPNGWVLCNGSNGTPDLRDRFIVGAGVSYNPGDTGGSNTHDHPFTGDGHYHNLSPFPLRRVGDGFVFKDQTTTTAVTGTTDTGSNVPVYYALAFIMKV